ncbi:MAG: aminoglycoside phosphotransferase family protein [Parachlamydiaceae bacterium]|nr:aminoglycoside phosphotransferase family protein [Parachlamydiaceae bacterium]
MKKYNINFLYLLTICYLALTILGPLTASDITPRLLEHYDEESIITVIHDEVPNLTINSIKLISSGWDNLVADINDEWIFRFPRSEVYILIFERDKKLLDLLHKQIMMMIPIYEYVGVHTSFVAYRKIPGKALHKNTYLTLPVETRQQIADTLALFLTQLHNAINIDEALQWGYKEYRLSLQWIEGSLFGTIPSKEVERILREALAYEEGHPCDKENQVFLHNDLHGENLAIDRHTSQVNGVFDFSDAVIGDYSIDFGKLFEIHEDLAIRTAETYVHLTGKENPVFAGAVDYILRRGQYILYARENGEKVHESRLLLMLENFVSVWDKLNGVTKNEESCCI